METKEQLETLVIRLALIIKDAKRHLEKHFPGKQYPGWSGCQHSKEWSNMMHELDAGMKRAESILERSFIR